MMSQSLSFKKSKTYIYLQNLFSARNIDEKDKVTIGGYKFFSEEVDEIQDCLSCDAGDTMYKMIFSFLSALSDMELKNYSWATIKFYYSIFYYMKSKLLFDGIHITYFNNCAYALNIKNKNKMICLDRNKKNSHQVVFDYYFQEFSQRDKLLMLEINDEDSEEMSNLYKWYENKRNIVNYRSIRFEEPLIYDFWEQVIDYDNIEDLFNNIIKDEVDYVYATNEDYAIIAIPIFCLINMIITVNVKEFLSDDEFNCLKKFINQNTYCEKLFNSISTIKNVEF